MASELNPASGDIDEVLTDVRSQLRTKVAVNARGQDAARNPDRALPRSAAARPGPAGRRRRCRRADVPRRQRRDVFTRIGRFANVNIVFDPTFRDQPVTIDLRKSTLEAALQAVGGATRNFYRVTAPADRDGRSRHARQAARIRGRDRPHLLSEQRRPQGDDRHAADRGRRPAGRADDRHQRDHDQGHARADRRRRPDHRAIDKARPEVVIDVELLEVDRTRLKEYGLQIASPGTRPGIDGQVVINRDGITLRDLRNLTQADVLLTNLPGLFYRLLKTDTRHAMLANPQLRTSEGMPAQASFGERVPVPVTTFSPIATGGVAQQPITSFNYENIGVNIDITPRTHHDDEVSLAVKIQCSSISGTGFGGLPTFGNRAINTVIRLQGRRNQHAGRPHSRRRAPGSSRRARAERHAGRRAAVRAHARRETQETDIILTLTPRIVRVLDLSGADLRAVPRRPRRRRAAGDIPRPVPIPAAPRPPAGSRTAAAPPPGRPASRAPRRRRRPLRPPTSRRRRCRPAPWRRHSAGRRRGPLSAGLATLHAPTCAPSALAAARRASRSRARPLRAGHPALPLGREGGGNQRHAGADVAAVEVRRRAAARAGHDDAVRIAEEQVGAHAAHLLEREEPQLVQPVVHERAPGGLRRKHGDQAHQVARKPRPEAGRDAAAR